MPFGAAQFDRIVCDGGLAFFDPGSIETLQSELARVLRPGGQFVVRLYVWDESETLDRVLDDLGSGSVSSASEARLRSWSALQTSVHHGVTVGASFAAVVARVGSLERLVERSGLDAREFLPFIASSTSTLRYTMWPVDDLVELWTRSGEFEFISSTAPDHHLGRLVPVLAFGRTPAS